jgi:hypothetical protein
MLLDARIQKVCMKVIIRHYATGSVTIIICHDDLDLIIRDDLDLIRVIWFGSRAVHIMKGKFRETFLKKKIAKIAST